MFLVSLDYSDFFDGPIPDQKKLLNRIPTKTIIRLVALLNAELRSNKDDYNLQTKLLEIFIKRQPKRTKNDIYHRLQKLANRSSKAEVRIFAIHINLEFLHQTLLTQYVADSELILNQEDELNILKAYLITAYNLNKNFSSNLKIEKGDEFYRKLSWPFAIQQIHLNHISDYWAPLIKAKCMLDYLQFDTPYGHAVEHFLKQVNQPNGATYIYTLVQVIQGINLNNQNKTSASFEISVTEELKSLFDSLSLEPENYQENDYYNSFKEKPLFKSDENSYIVIDQSLLISKLYTGLLFDFYRKTTISAVSEFDTFIKFKSHLSENFVEKELFVKTIKAMFPRQDILQFDSQLLDSHPDAYVRCGKRIFLFEIKDAFFPSKIITSADYNAIKDSIDQKYNSKKKGTGQLISQIEILLSGGFEKKPLIQQGIKLRNIVIYPIIIYNDPHYSTPGIMKYIQEEFSKKIFKKELQNKFLNIKDLTFVSIDFLISNLDLFKTKKIKLHELIDHAIIYSRKCRKRHKRHPTDDTVNQLNYCFDFQVSSYMNFPKNERDHVSSIFEVFDFKRGLDLYNR